MSRSIWPSRSPLGFRTAVPSTRSLAISGCGLSRTSVIITLLGSMKPNQRAAAAGVPFRKQASGCERLGLRIHHVEERHRLEPVVASPAAPEIGDAFRALLDPFRGSDRLAALSTGISSGQIPNIDSCHGAFSLFFWLGANGTGLLPDTFPPPRTCSASAFWLLNGEGPSLRETRHSERQRSNPSLQSKRGLLRRLRSLAQALRVCRRQ